jgi:uncharacterized protein (TIGR02646 family)
MIRIARCAEPAGLHAVRDERLEAAREAIGASTKFHFTEYDIVKPALAVMQHNKCCYCEKREEQAKYRDVEHYRPKSVYWWLAWTWENLLFSCVDCNREHKRDRFPLSSADRALVAEQAPPGGERPMVLDPTDPRSDPMTHIEFRREKVQGRERWTPYGTTERGWQTIDVCGLARPGLLTLYKAHVDEHVRPRLERFEATLREQDSQAVFRTWDSVRRGLLARERPFRALSHDALNVLVPAAVRDRCRLELVRPGP